MQIQSTETERSPECSFKIWRWKNYWRTNLNDHQKWLHVNAIKWQVHVTYWKNFRDNVIGKSRRLILAGNEEMYFTFSLLVFTSSSMLKDNPCKIKRRDYFPKICVEFSSLTKPRQIIYDIYLFTVYIQLISNSIKCIMVGNGHSYPNSNSRGGCLCFTFMQISLGTTCFHLFFFQLWVNIQPRQGSWAF